jgi:tetratricopeptide (TPR) repeat protein
VAGVRYEYNPDPYDARRISLKFNPNTQVIESIDLYLKKQYPKSQFAKWFQLTQPSRSQIDANGNLIEFYQPAGIALHYQGPNDKSPVNFFSHLIDEDSQAATKPPSNSIGDSVPYLGVAIRGHQGQGFKVVEVKNGSPAHQAGIVDGDVILELDKYDFYRSKIESSEFVVLLHTLPVDVTLDCVVKRGMKKLQLPVRLQSKNPSEIAEESRRSVRLHFDAAQKAVDREKYDEAILHLQKVIQYNDRDATAFELLGFCHYKKQRFKEAIQPLEEALKRNPDSPFAILYLGVSHDMLNNKNRAIAYYRQYLQLGEDPLGRKKSVEKRIATLERRASGGADTTDNLQKLLEIIAKDFMNADE